MKIIKCHIENFGKLEKQDFEFTEGFNIVSQKNGYGKTTLATFIKAMFYGMPCTTKKQLKENERKKFTPWQGGNYGGYIDFELDGEQYRVERFFGKKEAEDTFRVINLKTGKDVNKYNANNLGESLFELDAEAYERSTFIPQKEIESGINEKISTKLINMVQGTDTADSFENAVQIIKDRSLELKKQRGGTGLIKDVEDNIFNVSNEIDDLKRSVVAIDKLSQDLLEEDLIIRKLEDEKQQISDKIAECVKKQEVIANKKYINEKKKEKLNLEKNIDGYNYILNDSNVSLPKLDEIYKKQVLLNEKETTLKLLKENSKKSEDELILENQFKDGAPDKEEVNLQLKKAEKLNLLKSEIDNAKTQEVNNIVSKSKSKLFLLPLILGFVLAVAGCVFVKSNICVPCFVVACILLFLSAFMYFKKYIEQRTSLIKETKSQSSTIEDKVKEKDLLQKELEDFLIKYKQEASSNLISDLFDLRSKVETFYKLKSKFEKTEEDINDLEKEINLIKNEINSFFKIFNFDKELSNEEKINVLKGCLNNLGKDIVLLNNVNNDLSKFDGVLVEDIEGDILDISTLQETEKVKQSEIDEHREAKTNINKKINDLNNYALELDNLEDQLVELKERRDELKAEHSILNKTIEFLVQANDNLTSKYKKPMQDGLNKYLKLILNNDFQEFNLDTELNVSFEKYGQSRNIEYLSKGYQGVVDLCIRFALIDVLFKKEKPFIILDDPFVNFDEDKLKNALNLVKEFSKEYQLIYFICHKSRA